MNSPAPTETIFKQLCLSLRNADPKVWDQFVSCFDVYTIEVMNGLTSAPADEILRMQGRAQQCKALLRIFAECHLVKKPPQQPAPSTEWMAP